MPNKQIQSLTVEGVTYDIVDNTSGYTKNVGTITEVKTTAGAHTTIDVTSGKAEFKVPTKTSDLTNDSGFLTSYTETDPIFVASVAHGITSTDITNWNNKLDSYTETDPTVPAWAKATNKPSYTFSEIGSKPTTISGYGITDAYTKTQVDGLVAGVLHYKGTKASVANLPTSDNVIGDVWHITADGSEYAWDGTIWQELGTTIDLSNYVTHGNTGSSTTGVTISDHSTGSIIGVQSTTTTASKASGANSTVPTLGDPIPTISASNVTVPIKNTSATTVPIKNANATTVPIAASATACDDITAWSPGSLTMELDTTDTQKLVITFTSPSLSYTARSITGVSGSTSIYGVQSSTTSVTGVQSSTTTASKVTIGESETDFGVTNAGTASTWSFNDVIVPIKNTSATTVVTGKSHSITDPGHTHTI